MDATLKKALEDLVLQDDDLERVGDALSEVNFFEAIGAVRSELRHSDFLAYLLDPRANHGLRDIFLKRFAQRAALDGRAQSSLTALDLGTIDLQTSTVEREFDNTDVLIVNERAKFVIVVENKVDTSEHSDQLARYAKAIRNRYQGYKTLFIYLTLDGDDPSEASYAAMSYAQVCHIVEEILASRQASLHDDVAVLLRHYKTLLRRHFMEEDELAVLARRIYAKHKLALDYIFEQRPDFRSEISDRMIQLVRERPELELDVTSKTHVKFAPREWSNGDLMLGKGWTPSGRLLMFEFILYADRALLALIIGPSDSEVRKHLFSFALAHRPPFKFADQKLYAKWNRIWTANILSASDFEEQNFEAAELKLTTAWAQFLTTDLPALIAAIGDWESKPHL